MFKRLGIAKCEDFGFCNSHSDDVLSILERIMSEAKIKCKVNI